MSEPRRTAEALLRAATGARRIGRLCPRCGSDAHGRPTALGTAAHVSISYAGDLVAVAWSYDAPVGIDLESAGPGRQEWTRVEALLKATGDGLHDWPDVVLPDLPTQGLDLPAGYVGTLAGGPGGWRVAANSSTVR